MMSSPQITAVMTYVMLRGTKLDGVTQKEISEATGISQSSVSRILKSTVGFQLSIRPVFPYGYWFDASLVTDAIRIHSSSSSPAKLELDSESVTKITPKNPSQVTELADRLVRVSDEVLRSELIEVASAIRRLSENDTSVPIDRLAVTLFAVGLELERRWLTEH